MPPGGILSLVLSPFEWKISMGIYTAYLGTYQRQWRNGHLEPLHACTLRQSHQVAWIADKINHIGFQEFLGLLASRLDLWGAQFSGKEYYAAPLLVLESKIN